MLLKDPKNRRGDRGARGREAPPPTLDGLPLPADLELEKDVLGACLRDHLSFLRVRPALSGQAAAVVGSDPFFGEDHQIIWTAMLAVVVDGGTISVQSVRSMLNAGGNLQRIGGSAYLTDLYLNRGLPDDILRSAEDLLRLAKLRGVIGLSLRAAAAGREAADRIDEFCEDVQRELNAIVYGGQTSGQQLAHVGPTVDAAVAGVQQRYESPTQIGGVATGYATLDAKTGGIHVGDVWYVAARPGAGKTSCLLGVAKNISLPPPPEKEPPIEVPEYGVALFSLEMPSEQIASRLICMSAEIGFERWRSGKLRDTDWGPAYKEAERLKGARLWVDDTPNISIEEAEAKLVALKSVWDRDATFVGCPLCTRPLFYDAEIARWFCPACHSNPRSADAVTYAQRQQLTRERRVAVAMFDYFGLMRGDPHARSREEEMGGISRGLKTLAKRRKVGVVCAAQLNRAVEQRAAKEKMPQLSDLRETGSLEQDADLVLFLYRASYYRPNDEKARGKAVWNVAKQRNGSTGLISMRYEDSYSCFFDDQTQDLPAGL
jgi:replicative DNA helicase